MKLLKQDLLPAINALMPIAGRRTSLPALNCIRLEGTNGHLSLRASNLDCDSTLTVTCNGKLPAVCVPARHLHALVSGGADTVTLEPEDKLRLKVESDGVARLACLDPAEFVAMPDKTAKAIGVNAEDLSRSIRSVAWAALPHPNDLAFVYVFVSAKQILCVGSDRKTVVFSIIPAIGAACEFKVPQAQAAMFADALLCPGAQLLVGEKNCAVRHDGGEFYVRLAESGGPDPRKFMEITKTPVGSVAVQELLRQLSRCCCLSADEYAPTALTFSKSGIALDFNGGANGYQATIPGSFKDYKAKFDAFRLVKALKAFEVDEVALSKWDNGTSFEGGEILIGVAHLQWASTSPPPP